MNQSNLPVNRKEKSNPSIDSLPSDFDEAVLRELFDLPNWIDLLKYERSFDHTQTHSLPPPPTRMPLSSIDHLETVIRPPEAFRDSSCATRPVLKRKFVQDCCRPTYFTNFTSSSLPKKRSKLMISN